MSLRNGERIRNSSVHGTHIVFFVHFLMAAENNSLRLFSYRQPDVRQGPIEITLEETLFEYINKYINDCIVPPRNCYGIVHL